MTTSNDILREEAERLSAIYKAKKLADPSLNQDKIADACGWSSQSVVSQYMRGRIPLNLGALLKLAAALKVSPAEISPRLAAELGAAASHELTPVTTPSYEMHSIEAWDDETPLGPDEVELPFFSEVELSAGRGSEVMLQTNGRKLRFGKRTLQKKNISTESAACVTVTGNSMEPVLPEGSTVGVDTSMTAIQDGQMYAIDHDGQLRVKVLYKLPAGGIRMRSYNVDEWPDERYEGPYVASHIKVIGKVFWYSVLI
ncbi:transcriptional regulator [Pseudomonas sp. Pc102]|uniref:S24 family peptidase n=1 Tax=Pseudomonas sp. Pc102 TaxID=2678261 RepID=UPI00039863A1|nr:helix-turn-helix transcriptional regulator [Pseudomonas sp. Pc102]EQM66059.1 transcriptional regulator [Pseudomonas alcaligenes OT 69]MDN4144957.1 helix-turn-helix transcriptional regulator [Pseudomonas tohonis]BBP81149.1 transcriptional regulator [Pseudomonas sp. Pc102]